MTKAGADYAEGAALAYFNSPKRSGLLIQAGPVFWILFCGVLLIAAVAAGTGVIIDRSRDKAIQTSQRELRSTALLLARHFERQIRDFEAVQESFARKVDGDVGTAGDFSQRLSTEDIHQLLRTKVNESPDFSGVNIFDAKGDYINSSERWPVPSINISDRAYFKAFKSGATPLPLLIEVVHSRVSSGQTVVLARKIMNSRSEFVGIITRSIAPQVLKASCPRSYWDRALRSHSITRTVPLSPDSLTSMVWSVAISPMFQASRKCYRLTSAVLF